MFPRQRFLVYRALIVLLCPQSGLLKAKNIELKNVIAVHEKPDILKTRLKAQVFVISQNALRIILRKKPLHKSL